MTGYDTENVEIVTVNNEGSLVRGIIINNIHIMYSSVAYHINPNLRYSPAPDDIAGVNNRY